MTKSIKLLLCIVNFGLIISCADVRQNIEPSYTYTVNDPLPAPNLSQEAWNSPALGWHIHRYLRNPGPWYNPDPQTYDSIRN